MIGDRSREMSPQVAVVGCGQWGKNLVRNFVELGALRVVCDIDQTKVAALKEQYPGVEATSSYQEVLLDPGVHAVVIATPAASHTEQVRAALEAGKDVFVEKPLALTVSDGRELVALADKANRILMVGHLLRYHPGILKLKELIDGGQLGKIQYVYSNRLNLGRFRTEENILWSFAPHDISVVLYLLGERPSGVQAQGGSYLHPERADVTVTTLRFPSGVTGHIFVSWLHPYKEQKLVVVGDRGMAVFDDVAPERKLTVFNHAVEWKARIPVPRQENGRDAPIATDEPLQAECRHFLECIATRKRPRTDGEEGLAVLEVLDACQRSLDGKGGTNKPVPESPKRPYFAHETAVIDEPCEIGAGTKIWHFTHIMKNSRIGKRCNLGQNVVVSPDVVLGDNVKVQNNVSIYTGVIIEDDVFCGPSMVFTNVINPRSHVVRRDEYMRTLVKQGASLGANCTIVCGVTIGRFAFIGAGAVIVKDVPDFGLVVGNPGRIIGWMCMCGNRIDFAQGDGAGSCRVCKQGYVKTSLEVWPKGEREVAGVSM
jgi:UDP-2-acetamido-3-amino-2,3-dideoxy-glucuronate N-acetyltransferase